MSGPYEDITKECKEDDDNNIVINTPNDLADVQLEKTVSEWIYVLGFLF